MKNASILIALFALIVFNAVMCINTSTDEGFGGGGGHGGGGRGGHGGHGGYGGHGGHVGHGGGYSGYGGRRYSGWGGWGGWGGGGYYGYPLPLYTTPVLITSSENTLQCMKGCTNEGSGNWKCVYEGNNPGACAFDSDCNGCGN